jgi:hypothetical protein
MRIEGGAFSGCPGIKSIYVPASVEVLCTQCFWGLTRLSLLTFEPGSKLREIEKDVFMDCKSLKSILLPASLSVVHGSSFDGSSIDEVKVDERSPHYFVSHNSLICYHGMRLIRHFGLTDNVIIPRECEIIDSYCFSYCKSIAGVDFESDSKMTRIEPYAFPNCSALLQICIPAAVEMIGDSSFKGCSSLSRVAFESHSRLSQIGLSAFEDCSQLIEMCIPAHVGCIPMGCFTNCASLAEITFEPGSELTRIDPEAFAGCESLRLIAIPARLEFIAGHTFRNCISLSQLRFESPSQLQQLELPPSDFGDLSIPNSVECVTGFLPGLETRNRILRFESQSHLRKIDFVQPRPWWELHRPPLTGSSLFVCLSEQSLRRFRSRFEAE